ncbi:hypothetical protein MLD38_008825 [Melastoma candidum]|uniref:Uncharacterized protein n=1 Tax=Melastoma candidum TaxID=119954 RepID=A0ACB9RXI6_9MYRT|nr:hypothetical protein MLD38_008825 [Melastoma candidum]
MNDDFVNDYRDASVLLAQSSHCGVWHFLVKWEQTFAALSNCAIHGFSGAPRLCLDYYRPRIASLARVVKPVSHVPFTSTTLNSPIVDCLRPNNKCRDVPSYLTCICLKQQPEELFDQMLSHSCFASQIHGKLLAATGLAPGGRILHFCVWKMRSISTGIKGPKLHGPD